jgi:hypothetical protein
MDAFEDWVVQAKSVRLEDELARRGIKLAGKNERAGPCPKCGGTDRFSINCNKQVWNCRGCGKGGDIIELVQHLDGSEFVPAVQGLAGSRPQVNGKANGKHATRQLVATYDYVDANGATVFQVLRYSPKGFKQRRPDSDKPGQWLWGLDGVNSALPYRLPELIEAMANGHTILIPEGEKDCDSLARMGVPATCNAMGAEKWAAEHAAWLRGANCVVVPHNDDKGRRHAECVARSLQGIAASVRLLELPDLPPKGDVSDWIAAGGTREELDALVDDAPAWKAQQDNDPSAAPPRSITPTPFALRPAEQIKPRERLFGNFVRKFVSVTVGRTKGGKTLKAIAEVLAMTTGKPLLGIAPEKPLRVWYIGEDPGEEIERRIAAVAMHYRIQAADIGNRLFIDSVLDGKLPRLRIAEVKNRATVVNEAEVVNALIEGMKANAIDVLVLDPLIKFHGVPESDNPAMEAVVSALIQVATQTNSAVELLHHIRKQGAGTTNSATIDDGRGATAVISAARSARVQNRMSSQEAMKAGIPEKERWRYFRVDSEDNMAPPEADVWYRLASVTLPCGDSVGVVETWKFPDAFENITARDMETGAQLARTGEYRADSRAKNWYGLALARALNIPLIDKPENIAKIKSIIKKWTENEVLAVEERNDEKSRRREYIVPGPKAPTVRTDLNSDQDEAA